MDYGRAISGEIFNIGKGVVMSWWRSRVSGGGMFYVEWSSLVVYVLFGELNFVCRNPGEFCLHLVPLWYNLGIHCCNIPY